MIELRTGVPGAGKTLFAIQEVNELAERDKRTVYYNGISDLKLPWVELDDPTAWDTVPAGSIVVIDEAQRVFRPRHIGSAVPAHVAALETHRHKGIDLVLITQHPKLLDPNVRRLVGRHVHFLRPFGIAGASRLEFQECSEDLGDRDNAQRTVKPYPKELFGVYKSAEVHTHKFRLPRKLIVLALVVPLAIGAIYFAVNKVRSIPKETQERVASATGRPAPGAEVDKMSPGSARAASSSPGKALAQWFADQQPRVPGLAHTAPVYDAVTVPQEAPYPAACLKSSSRCRCYSQQATVLDMPDSLCEQIVSRGFFVAWKRADAQRPTDQQAPVDRASSSSQPVALGRSGDLTGSRDGVPESAVSRGVVGVVRHRVGL